MEQKSSLPTFLANIKQECLLFHIDEHKKKIFDRRCFGKNYTVEQVEAIKQPNQQVGIMYDIKDTYYAVIDIDTDDYTPEDLFNDSDIDSCYVKGNTKGWHVWMQMKNKTDEYKKNKVDCGLYSTIDFLGEKVFECIGKEWFHDDACLLHDESIAKALKSGTFEKRLVSQSKSTGSSNLKLLEKVVALIDIKYCDNRSGWVKLVLAMKKVGFSFEFADAWYKRSGGYSSAGMETTWNSYTSDGLITAGEGTIRYYAKKSSATEYAELLNQPVDADNVFANDAEASDKIIEMLQDRLLYCDGRMYMKLGNCWICDQIEINNALMTFIMNADIYKLFPKNKLVPVWKDYSPADKVYKTICCRITESAFDKELFHSTTKHRVAFKNGVLDFKAKKFYTWDEITFPYYTTNIIKIEYKVETEYESLVDKVFEPIFGDKTDLALKYISRAIAGCIEDKNFATYMGNRNCGKGALFELLKVFGSYVSAFNIECLKEDSKSTSTARDFYWMLPLEFTRLAISQEVPQGGCILRSDLVKKICSGGDTLTARRNYDRKDTDFKVECSIFCLGNNEITTHGDVNEHRLVFEGATSYQSQAQYDAMIADGADSYTMNKFRIADDKIKDKCKSYDWQMKAVALLLSRFVDERIVVLQTDIEDQEDMSLLTKLLECYDITRIESHLVLGSDIHDIYGKKVKAELKSLGVEYKKVKQRQGPFRDKFCYVGIEAKLEPKD